MDHAGVDGLTGRPASRTSRRVAVGSALAGMTLALGGRKPLAAREATPAVAPEASTDAGTGGWTAVEALIRDAEATGGEVGVAVHDADGELFAHKGDRRFHAASTIKVPIMIEAWRQVERGTLSLDDRYVLRDEDRVPGSGVLSTLHAGLELTFADLLDLMITVSDNTATNLVIDQVGLDTVNGTMAELGMTGSELGRPMLGRLPAAGDPENWATPGDFALAMQAIASGEAAEPESCARMLETMERQEEIRRISRFIPDGADARWGSKPGDLPGVVNDVGFVTSDRSTVCIAIFCEDLPDLDAAERAIGLIARETLDLTGIVPFDAAGSS
jgi:beta-lactamase class A